MTELNPKKTNPVSSNKSHTIQYLSIKALRSTHPEVRRLKRNQSIHSAHGNKVWRSSFVLLDYLTTYPPKPKARVLDVGCGWGLTSIFLAKQFGADVTAIDIDPGVEPFLTLQASINNCLIRFREARFEDFTQEDLGHFHTIVAADICFWDEMVHPLKDFIYRALEAGVKQIYIADPGRPPYWELCDYCVEAFDAEIATRRIYEPWKTEKFILSINRQ
jgi:predicted nicotinamide N-methyase